MAKKSGKGYLGIGNKIINLILAIIPVTSWILGGIERIKRNNVVAGVLQLLLPPVTLVFWILDIITMITDGDLKYFA